MTQQILIIDPDSGHYTRLIETLNETGIKHKSLQYCPLKSSPPEAKKSHIIINVCNEDLTLLDEARKQLPLAPYTAVACSMDTAMAALQKGAHSYILSENLNAENLITALQEADARVHYTNKLHIAISEHNQLFQNSPLPRWIYDRETLKFLAVNNAAIESYGYTRDEFLTMTLADIRPAEDVADLLNIIKNIDISEEANTDILRHKKKSGEIFYVKIYSQPITYYGKPARIVAAIDVHTKVETERQNGELNKIIEQQKKQLNTILQSIGEVVWAVKMDTRELLYITEACEKVYGYTAAEMKADPKIFYRQIHPDDLQQFQDIWDETIKEGKSGGIFRITDKAGKVKYLRGNATIKKGINDEPDIISGLTVDVTELVEKDLELQEKIEEVETILASIKDGFFVIDEEWKFSYVNKEFERMFNVEREQIIGKNYWEKFPKAVHQKFYTEYNSVMKDGVSRHFEEYSSALSMWVSVSVYRSKKGLSVFFTDITEERRLQQQIATDQRNLRALINNTQDRIWSVDENICIISANDAYIESVKALTGAKVNTGDYMLAEEWDKELIDRWRAYYNRAFADETFEITERLRVLEGKEMYAEIRFNPIHDNEGNVVGVSCFSRDITEQRMHMMYIEEQNQRLKEIAWFISHMVRGPVASVLGLAELFNINKPDDADNVEIIKNIKEAAQKLDEIIVDINERTKLSGLEELQ